MRGPAKSVRGFLNRCVDRKGWEFGIEEGIIFVISQKTRNRNGRRRRKGESRDCVSTLAFRSHSPVRHGGSARKRSVRHDSGDVLAPGEPPYLLSLRVGKEGNLPTCRDRPLNYLPVFPFLLLPKICKDLLLILS